MQCLVSLLNVLPDLTGLFSSPIPCFGFCFLNHKHTFFNWESPCVLFAIFTRGCLSTRNSLSVNLDSRVLFPFPNKLWNRRDLQSLKRSIYLDRLDVWLPLSEANLTFGRLGVFETCGCVTLHWLLNYCLFWLLCSELFGSLDRLTVTDWQIRLIFFYPNVATNRSFFSRPATDGCWSFLRLNSAVYSRVLSVTAWKQSGKNTLPVPWAALFTKPISRQRYALTPLDPRKSTSHWSEKLAVSHYARTPNALAFSVLPNNHLPVCLFAINDWISVAPPLPSPPPPKKKKIKNSALCMYPQHTQLLRVHTAACTAKLIFSL